MIFPAKIELLQLCDEFLLQCNGAHALPSEGTKPALAWWFTVDSGESDDEVCFFSSLASAASPGEWTIWPDGEREPKSKSRFNKE